MLSNYPTLLEFLGAEEIHKVKFLAFHFSWDFYVLCECVISIVFLIIHVSPIITGKALSDITFHLSWDCYVLCECVISIAFLIIHVSPIITGKALSDITFHLSWDFYVSCECVHLLYSSS